MKKTLIKIGLLALLLISAAPYTSADTATPPIIPAMEDRNEYGESISTETLIIPHSTSGAQAGDYFQSTYLPEITRVVISIAGAAAFLFIIIGGIQILTAYGDEEKITGAKKTITYAIVGLVVSILSYAIVSIISGVQVTQVDEGSPEWQEANKGLDEDEQSEKAELQKEHADVPGSEDMTLEELQALE